ncbi:MAG: sialidase family protein [Thermoplasmatota archaeon]
MRAALLLAFAVLAAPVLAGCVKAPTTPGPASPSTPDLGASKFANVRVTNVNGPANEVAIAVNPKDPMNLIGGAKDYTLGASADCGKYRVWSGYYWSKDGGKTWGNGLMPGWPGDKTKTLLSHYKCNSDPVVAFGSDGTAYYSGLAYGGFSSSDQQGLCPSDAQAALACGGSIWTARSTDGGATWKDFVNVAIADDNNVGLDKQWFAVDPSDPKSLTMTWIQFTGVAAYFMTAHSADGALTWTPPVTVTEIGAQQHQFIMPAVGPDGTVYATWRSFGDDPTGMLPSTQQTGPSLIFTKTAAPDSPTWTPGVPIASVVDIPSPLPNTKFRDESIPSLAVDSSTGPNKGSIYVAWADYAKKNADILLVYSRDQGMTWSAPVTVNPPGDTADQFMPWVAIDPKGGVNVVYLDRHYSTTPANTALDVTLARSLDGGKTFTTERVTNASWMPNDCYHQTGPEFIGDYQGLAVGSDMVAHPLWASGISGPCEVYSAAVPLS